MILVERPEIGQPPLFRCSHDGQTLFGRSREELRPCSCGKGVWLLYAADNVLSPENLYFVYVVRPNRVSFIQATKCKSLTVGNGVNLDGQGLNGAFIITQVYETDGLVGLHPAINIQSVGPFDPDLPAFMVFEKPGRVSKM